MKLYKRTSSFKTKSRINLPSPFIPKEADEDAGTFKFDEKKKPNRIIDAVKSIYSTLETYAVLINALLIVIACAQYFISFFSTAHPEAPGSEAEFVFDIGLPDILDTLSLDTILPVKSGNSVSRPNGLSLTCKLNGNGVRVRHSPTLVNRNGKPTTSNVLFLISKADIFYISGKVHSESWLKIYEIRYMSGSVLEKKEMYISLKVLADCKEN